jgi:hypothetical protein
MRCKECRVRRAAPGTYLARATCAFAKDRNHILSCVGPGNMAVADVNYDGKLDFVTANSVNTVTMRRGNGKLAFKRIHGQEDPYSVRVGLGWRALGLVEGDTISWFWIGSHADYDAFIN